jgi:hypothetical protein
MFADLNLFLFQLEETNIYKKASQKILKKNFLAFF